MAILGLVFDFLRRTRSVLVLRSESFQLGLSPGRAGIVLRHLAQLNTILRERGLREIRESIYEDQLEELTALAAELGVPLPGVPKLRARPRHARDPLCAEVPAYLTFASDLHALRRAYLLASSDRPVTPPPVGWDPSRDDELVAAISMESAHLLGTGGLEGLFVPYDLDALVIDARAPGGCIASSQAVLRELSIVAPALAIDFARPGQVSEGSMRALRVVSQDEPLAAERRAWFVLWENARCSVQTESLMRLWTEPRQVRAR